MAGLMDRQAHEDRLNQMQMEALGYDRRNKITTDEINDGPYVTVADLQPARKAHGRTARNNKERAKVTAWNNLHEQIRDDGTLEEDLGPVNEGLGQTHRAKLLANKVDDSISRARQTSQRYDNSAHERGKRRNPSGTQSQPAPRITKIRVAKGDISGDSGGESKTETQLSRAFPRNTVNDATTVNPKAKRLLEAESSSRSPRRPSMNVTLTSPNDFLAVAMKRSSSKAPAITTTAAHTISHSQEKVSGSPNLCSSSKKSPATVTQPAVAVKPDFAEEDSKRPNGPSSTATKSSREESLLDLDNEPIAMEQSALTPIGNLGQFDDAQMALLWSMTTPETREKFRQALASQTSKPRIQQVSDPEPSLIAAADPRSKTQGSIAQRTPSMPSQRNSETGQARSVKDDETTSVSSTVLSEQPSTNQRHSHTNSLDTNEPRRSTRSSVSRALLIGKAVHLQRFPGDQVLESTETSSIEDRLQNLSLEDGEIDEGSSAPSTSASKTGKNDENFPPRSISSHSTVAATANTQAIAAKTHEPFAAASQNFKFTFPLPATDTSDPQNQNPFGPPREPADRRRRRPGAPTLPPHLRGAAPAGIDDAGAAARLQYGG